MAATAELCSKCKKEPRADTDGTNPWCLKCRADYQREYNATKEGRAEAKGFARGARAMQEAIAASAERMGSGNLTGYEIAEVVRQMDAPEPA